MITITELQSMYMYIVYLIISNVIIVNVADHVEAEDKTEYLKLERVERSDNAIPTSDRIGPHHDAYRGAGHGQDDLGVVLDEGLELAVAAGQLRGELVVLRGLLALLGLSVGDAVRLAAAALRHLGRRVGVVRVVVLPVYDALYAAAFELKEELSVKFYLPI